MVYSERAGVSVQDRTSTAGDVRVEPVAASPSLWRCPFCQPHRMYVFSIRRRGVVSIALLVIVGSTATVPSVRFALGPVGAIVPGPASQYVFRVDGPTMEPTCHNGQYIQVQPLTAPSAVT